jgi:hypothetical protein
MYYVYYVYDVFCIYMYITVYIYICLCLCRCSCRCICICVRACTYIYAYVYVITCYFHRYLYRCAQVYVHIMDGGSIGVSLVRTIPQRFRILFGTAAVHRIWKPESCTEISPQVAYIYIYVYIYICIYNSRAPNQEEDSCGSPHMNLKPEIFTHGRGSVQGRVPWTSTLWK